MLFILDGRGKYSNLPGFRTLFSDRFVWFPYRVNGISPGVQSEINLYRKYQDFEEGGWDIMAGVRPAHYTSHTCRADRTSQSPI